MAKLIRINRKLARLGGKLVLDTGGAPCCCGGGSDCPNCVSPGPTASCAQNSPCNFYRKPGGGNTCACIGTIRRHGSITFDFDWNGYRVLNPVNRSWDQTDVVPYTVTSQNSCAPSASLSVITEAFNYRVNNVNQQGQLRIGSLTNNRMPLLFNPFSGAGLSCCYGPDCGQSRNTDGILVHNTEIRVIAGIIDMGLLGRPWAEHGTQATRFAGQWSLTGLFHGTLPCDDVTDKTATATLVRNVGSCACRLNTRIVAAMSYSGVDGTFSLSTDMNWDFEVTCIYSRSGIGPDGGDDRILDPGILDTLERQARGGGCAGCGDGFK